MRPRNEYHDARRMLVELFRQPDDGPIIGIDEFSNDQREFMKTTCASTVMLYTICYIAGFDADEAKRGLKALELEKLIDEICEL
jgi:hypothetical protein